MPTDPAAETARDGSSLGDLVYLVPTLARGLVPGNPEGDSGRPLQQPTDSPEGQG
ncbi:hypothetical protein [Streptomyces sp. 13-12-16]|uniref:hypothetical protein n=1 Tax=Streptomyces sp. 13-12-16 TaxID=1570823 RepID=UPI0015C43052|nr:hypothetical protein [Streptomyces sp. 13-12-16]